MTVHAAICIVAVQSQYSRAIPDHSQHEIPQSHRGCDRTATVLWPIFRPNRVRSQ